MQLLRELLSIPSPSGNERPMRDFIIIWLENHKHQFRATPHLIYGDNFQNCLAVVFGKPRLAVFAHMDTIGYMVRYGHELVCIGSPHAGEDYILVGEDSKGAIECGMQIEGKDEHRNLFYRYGRDIDRGTELVFKPDFIADEEYIQSPYLDNRIGIWNALRLAETMEDGILVFSCWEEHDGGATAFMGRFIYEEFGVRKALISDVTWATHGILHGGGAVISLRDSNIPRRDYVKEICSLANESGIPWQLEVEENGGSDGNELQNTPYPIDWCFVGAACSNTHSPRERILRADAEAMHELYRYLIPRL